MAKDQSRDRSQYSAKAVVVAVVVLIGLPILYVLSVGPAIWLQANGYMSEQAVSALEVLYAPIGWLAGHSEFCNKVLLAYLSFWVDLR